jgi:hypothetical protein
MRRHTIDQITWRLFNKAQIAYRRGDYLEVVRIGATQFPYNVCGAGIYYDLPKENTYEKCTNVSIAAVSDRPIELRAGDVLRELESLTEYFRNLLPTEVVEGWTLGWVKE